MIPRTFPSSVAANGSTQMIVYFLPSVSGLTRWVDYIPVKFTTVASAATENTYNQDGYIPVASLSSIAGFTPFKEYVPVFLDGSAVDADVWDVSITGFIPVGDAGIGGAALYLDFTATTTLDPRITFARSSTATFTGSNGLIQTAAINAPRFDYDPVTLASKGLLIEEQRTNLLLNTSVLGTQGVTVAAVAHTLSFYGTGTVVLSGTHSATVVGLGAYPTRTTYIFTPSAGNLVLTVTGSVLNAQLEAGAFATSYIPTVASQVTRAPDNATMTGTNFSSWYNQSEGTLFSKFVMEGVKSTGAQRILQVDDGSDTNRIGLFLTSANSPQATVNIAVGNAGNATVATPVVVAGAQVMTAVAYKFNDFNLGYNGAVATTDTSVNIPLTLTTLRFAAAIASAQSNVWFQRLAFYPRRLSNAELQGITS